MTRDQLAILYSDVKATLDAALMSSGGTLKLATKGAAVRYRHKCYTFRKKWREASPSPSLYDLITIKTPEDNVLTFAAVQPPSGFKPAGGPSLIPTSVPDPEDELLAEALNIAEKIFGDD